MTVVVIMKAFKMLANFSRFAALIRMTFRDPFVKVQDRT